MNIEKSVLFKKFNVAKNWKDSKDTLNIFAVKVDEIEYNKLRKDINISLASLFQTMLYRGWFLG